MLKLNLGSGGRTDAGWVHLDKDWPETFDPSVARFVQHDLREPLPFDDNSVDMIVCHHVLDLLADDDWHELLREIRRVLTTGGYARFSLADLMLACRKAMDGDINFFDELGAPDLPIEEALHWYVTQYGARRSAISRAQLNAALVIEEFDVNVIIPAAICELDCRLGESFFVTACKLA